MGGRCGCWCGTCAMLMRPTVRVRRYSGNRDCLVGTPVASRSEPETESLVGLPANTIVLRADLRGDPTVAEFIDRVRAMCLSAFEHHDVPFEKVVEQLAPTRDQS